MTPSRDQALLDLWERVETATPTERPAALLDGLRDWVGEGGGAPAGSLPVGRRDRALIDLRARLFGRDMHCATFCSDCGARIELAFDLASLPTALVREQTLFRSAGVELGLRPPTTHDLLDVIALPPAERAAALVRRCASGPIPDPLPQALIEAASAALAEADPDADIELATACPDCGTAHALTFDIATCVWDDLVRAARRLLREVHHLATAYGWSEAEILAVPRRRRLEYLLAGST